MSRSSQALLHEYTQRLIEVQFLHAHTTASQYDHKIRQKGHCYELGRVSQKQMSACVAAFLCWIGGECNDTWQQAHTEYNFSGHLVNSMLANCTHFESRTQLQAAVRVDFPCKKVLTCVK